MWTYIYINIIVLFNSVSTGSCHRYRSSSVDVLIEQSSSIGPNVSLPSEVYRNKISDQSEASYLVVCERKLKKEDDYVNYQAEDNGVNKSKIISTEKNSLASPSVTNQIRSDKPETSSNSTASTVAPSVSSSSSSAPHSVAPLSPVSMDRDLKSPSSLHDSTISRLIDAVSLGNEQDTCGSISALIGQFESTFDQNNFTGLSHDHTPSSHSNFRSTTPKVVQNLRSPLKTNKESPKTKQLSNVNHKMESLCKISQSDTPAPAILSSPETTELEEVYTILDEEVLSPISVYNLKKQTVHVQADTTESTPGNSLGSSPPKVAYGVGGGHSLSWGNMYRKRGESEEIEEDEERIYEEVYDPPAAVPDRERVTSKKSTSSFVNDSSFQFLHNSAGDAFGEVEINVDEDPLDMMLTSSTYDSQLEGLISPTKRQAIYQNHESTPKYFQQQPSPYCNPQQYSSHASHVAFSQCPSPINQPSYQLSNFHQHQNYGQPVNSKPSNHSPLRQNSYPVPQSNSKAFDDSRDFSSSCTQQRSYSGSQLLNRPHKDRQGYKHIEKEQSRCFQNGFSSSESLPGQSAVNRNICRDRGPYSLSSDCDAVVSHVDFITPSAETQTQSHNQTQSHTLTQHWNQKVSHTNTHQPQTETGLSLHSDLGPLSTHSQSPTINSIAPSPCKSKSLGDLTSEDISCNFQSKYHIISRSFITPHMRKQKRMGSTGEVTFQSQSCDPLTEQLRKLVSLEGEDSDRERPQPHLDWEAKAPLSQPQATSVAPVVPRDTDDSPPLLTRRLSSRSQSRVRHINSRARERQQVALKPREGVVLNATDASMGGVVLRNKPASQNPPANRHSTGSYIAGYLGQLEDRGLPEGACTSIRYGNGDHYGDRYHTDDSVPPSVSSHSASEPEVYFLLRL